MKDYSYLEESDEKLYDMLKEFETLTDMEKVEGYLKIKEISDRFKKIIGDKPIPEDILNLSKKIENFSSEKDMKDSDKIDYIEKYINYMLYEVEEVYKKNKIESDEIDYFADIIHKNNSLDHQETMILEEPIETYIQEDEEKLEEEIIEKKPEKKVDKKSNKNNKISILIIILLSIALIFTIFKSGVLYKLGIFKPKLVQFELKETLIELGINESYQIEPIVKTDPKGFEDKVEYDTKDTDIISIDETGKVTALKEVEAKVNISFFDEIKTLDIEVVDNDKSENLNFEIICERTDLKVGDYSEIIIDSPDDASLNIKMLTSNPNIVTVSDHGLVAAVGPGKASVNININGQVRKINFNVSENDIDMSEFEEYSDDYIFEDSHYRKLTTFDLDGLSKAEIGLARNEIFARHGFVFDVEPYKSYFESKSWYYPDSNFKGTEDDMNEVEKHNVNLCLEYEDNKKLKKFDK